MKILELQIKNFGKFSGKVISFHDGVNILYGENETGKSTIHAFIKGMFFGIERQRGRASRNDEYSLRQPWENPNYFAGVMRFESGGKVFRLERNFERRDKSASLICENDGEELSVADGDLEVLLEGLSETAFRNTLYLPQESGATDKGLAEEVQRFLNNLESSGDGDIDVKNALKALDEKRRTLEQDKRKYQQRRQDEIATIQVKLDYIEPEAVELETQVKAVRSKLQQTAAEEQQIRYQAERQNIGKIRRMPPPLPESQKKGLLILGLLLIVGGLFIGFMPGKILAIAAGIFLTATGALRIWRRREAEVSQEQPEAQGADYLKSRAEYLRQELDKQNWQLDHLQREQQEKRLQIENLLEAQQELQPPGREEERMAEEQQAIGLAVSCIQEVSGGFYRRSERALNERISVILKEVTGGRYDRIFIDEEFQVRVHTTDKILGLNQLSKGAVEQIYFALRMAAGELLCQGEEMPLILDEAFARYDDRRLENTLRWLVNSGKQVILFSCHRREEQLLNKIRTGQ